MRSDHTDYNIKDSVERIAKILATEGGYEEKDSIPAAKDLSYITRVQARCSVLCVSIRQSPQLTDFHIRPEFSKLYRAYISEVTAVMNGNPKCADIYVEDDSILGVFDTPFSEDMDEVFSTAGKISSIIDFINYQFKNTMKELSVGIGIAYGKASMLKVGYKGSGISDFIWRGEALDEASRLASYGNKDPTDRETMMSEIVYYNLSSENKKIVSYNLLRDCYHGDTVNVYMGRWFKQNCPL